MTGLQFDSYQNYANYIPQIYSQFRIALSTGKHSAMWGKCYQMPELIDFLNFMGIGS